MILLYIVMPPFMLSRCDPHGNAKNTSGQQHWTTKYKLISFHSLDSL